MFKKKMFRTNLILILVILFYYLTLFNFFNRYHLIYIYKTDKMTEEEYRLYGYRDYDSFADTNKWKMWLSEPAKMILFIHAISIVFFFGKIYESILIAFVHGARKIMMEDEFYILELFQEVYDEAIKEKPKISKKIKLFIIDSMNIEAYAFSNTILITKGAINTLSNDEIKGVLAHEFGHLSNLFQKLLLFVKASLFFGSLLITIYKFLRKNIDIAIEGKNDIYSVTVQSSFFIVDILFAIPIFIFQFFFAIGRRENEYYADEFAFTIGYGEELKSVLKIIYQMELTKKLSVMDRLMNSHPLTPERIANIETLINL